MLVLFVQNKGVVQSFGNYRGIKLMSHIIKLGERVVEARPRAELNICEQPYGVMPKKKLD